MSLGERGFGWSWGIPGFCIGVSGAGQRWFSIGLPGVAAPEWKYGRPLICERPPR